MDGTTPCPGWCEETDDAGNCHGLCRPFGTSCPGSCQGECFLPVGGLCDGRCDGTCDFVPPEGSCPPEGLAQCEASANAAVECPGSCEGELGIPEIDAECDVLVTAIGAQLSTCSVPPVLANYSLGAFALASFQDSPEAGAEFDQRLQCYAATVANAAAVGARIEVLARASLALAQSHDVFVAAAAVPSTDAGLCAEARLNLAPDALSSIADLLVIEAGLVARLIAVSR
jgi:hypothetical protein